MFEKGDIVECIESFEGTDVIPAIKRGDRYIVNDFDRCHCGVTYLFIGLRPKSISSANTAFCTQCKNHFPVRNYCGYKSSRFRKIEPSYKVVEVTENISEEIKKLVYN